MSQIECDFEENEIICVRKIASAITAVVLAKARTHYPKRMLLGTLDATARSNNSILW